MSMDPVTAMMEVSKNEPVAGLVDYSYIEIEVDQAEILPLASRRLPHNWDDPQISPETQMLGTMQYHLGNLAIQVPSVMSRNDNVLAFTDHHRFRN